MKAAINSILSRLDALAGVIDTMLFVTLPKKWKRYTTKTGELLDRASRNPFVIAIDESIDEAVDTIAPVIRTIRVISSSILREALRFIDIFFRSRPVQFIWSSITFLIEISIRFLDRLVTLPLGFIIQLLRHIPYAVRSGSSYLKATTIGGRLYEYALLIRFDKPIGTLLLLWPTLIAMWIAAEGIPDTDVLIVFIAGVFLMRSAGCAINDYADRHIDDKVKRTKARPLAAGRITKYEALGVFGVFSLTAFILVLTMNLLTIVMSFVGLALAASYPFMKRYHYLPQVHLGAAFGWAVPMAYAAQANELTDVTWLLFIATVLWATAYDTMYAMVDRDDDIKIGVKSTAILFGPADRLIIGVIQATLIITLLLIGTKLDLSGLYYLGLLIATGLAGYQQYLIKDRDKALCFKAFLNNNCFGLVLFVAIFLEYQIGGVS